ncbi:O-acetyltransferase OatA [Corynebacterium occultum]|uniref:O-acetyltransferase OatA n=1 Tax=Corynebacterium occultum TaxID=2675219 RepID=A0A6B8WET5_9CORY|nr:acyltransferase [Corynebacterium occultum]QGU08500.1 O-acetyltransferase OatA [Corynebacterium occultum]
MHSAQSYATGFIPSLEGLRAVAALGVLLTHVAFQTGMDPATFPGDILARFDFFVPVFFALSAFLLWRRHRRDFAEGYGVGRYYLNRLGRIFPAYLVLVVGVLLLLPEASGVSWQVALANLLMVQLYVPDALAPGLTHLWSLVVELAFYLALPLLGLGIGTRSRRVRLSTIVALGLVGFGWPWLGFVVSSGTAESGMPNMQIFPFSYLAWFAVGLLAAEYEGRVPAGVQRILRWRWLWWALALLTAWVAAQKWYGPLGLEHPTPWEFNLRVIAGTLFAAFVVVPYALAPGSRWLETWWMQALGRWSYSIFLWHLAVLTVAFPILGMSLFSGSLIDFLLMSAFVTVASVVVSAASYVLVEEPARRWVRDLGKGIFGDSVRGRAGAQVSVGDDAVLGGKHRK